MNFQDLPSDEFSQFYQKLMLSWQTLQGNYAKVSNNDYLPYSFYKKYLEADESSLYYCGNYDSTMYFYLISGNGTSAAYRFFTYDKVNNQVNQLTIPVAKFEAYQTAYNDTYFLYYGRFGSASINAQRFNCNTLTQAKQFGKIKLGSSYLDDFMYSNHSSDILITSLYFFIPVLVFILGIKVFRRGV